MSEPTSLHNSKIAPLQRRYAGATTVERQKDRRARLIEAALDIFGRERYCQATMRAICSAAAVSDRYFHESFDTLKDLYECVHAQLISELVQIIAGKLHSQSSSPIERARIGLTAFFEYIQADPRRARILLQDVVVSSKSIPEARPAGTRWYIDWFRSRLANQYPSVMGNVELDMIALGMIGMTTHVASVWTQKNFEAPVDLVVNHCLYAWAGLFEWLDDLAQRDSDMRMTC